MDSYSGDMNNYDTSTDDPQQQRRRIPRTQNVDYSGYTTNAAGGGEGMQPPSGSQPQQGAPQGAYDRNQFRDAWMGSGARTPQELQNFVAQHQGDFGAGVQILPGGKGDKIRLPDGTLIDAVIGAGLGGQGAGWTGDPSQMGGGPGGGGPGGGGPGGGGSGGGINDPMIQELLARLKGRADQSLNVNAATDPNIRAQADPYAANVERQKRQYLAAQAERLGPNANMTNEERLASEHAGQASAGFEASLVGGEIQARRQEIQQALTSMQSLLTDEQKMDLQRELAQLDDATRRLQIQSQEKIAGNSNDLGWARLGLDSENSYNDWHRAFGE